MNVRYGHRVPQGRLKPRPVNRPRGTPALSNLTSGTKYWFRVAAINPAGTGAWSDTVAKIAE